MTVSTLNQKARRLALLAACAPLLLLTGCPGDTSTAAANARPAQQASAPTIAPSQTATPPTPPPPDNNYRIQQVIANAERSYKSGVDNYQAGHLEAARNDFDFAVDILLTSGLDLKPNDNDPRLSDELDHLLNAVNSLELAALKQGNGFSAPVEASPIESAADLTFAPNPELTAKLKSELTGTTSDLPLVINDQVAGYINAFANSPTFHAHMLRSLERAGRYKAMIQKVLAEEGVPQDMIYLAVAESGFQPQALNAKSGAGGMWQFMPFGSYGLTRNGWFDERFDPEKSSRAYARYIKSLHDQFGDWYLAMAAYDWGPGNIQKAVMRTGYADFWELYRRNAMPAETKNYVPQILAAVIMAKNPAKYGLDSLVADQPVIWDTVTTTYATDLRLVADVTGSSLGDIVALNPSLLRMTTPNDLPFDLHIPTGTKQLFLDRIKEIPEEKRGPWRWHESKAGETLVSIATDLHAKPADVAEANGINLSSPLETGDELVIPIAGTAASVHPQRYSVRAGDTLITIADRFDVSVEDLRRWNNLSSTSVRPGRSLNVAQPVALAPSMRLRSRGRKSQNPHGSRTSRNSEKASAKASPRSSRATSRTATRPAAASAKKPTHAANSKAAASSSRAAQAKNK
jgi:membrane-bound lytic murein transglycosylase D